MSSIPKTPLESHVGRKMGLYPGPGSPGQQLTAGDLGKWHLDKLNETIEYARTHSPFYRRLFSQMSGEPLTGLDDLTGYPFTTAEDIRSDPMRFLCVSQDEIARVVTLQTSGTTHAAKRLFFTESDLESTIDFFLHGMSTLVEPGQRVLILMPGELPGSVGNLLAKALARMDVTGIVHGPVKDPKTALDQVIEHHIDCLVGIPVQVLAMARNENARAAGKGRIKSVLLSTDYIPDAVVAELGRVWD